MPDPDDFVRVVTTTAGFLYLEVVTKREKFSINSFCSFPNLPGPRHDGKYWICTDCATILAIHLIPSLSIKIASLGVFCKRPTIKVFFQLDFFLDTIGHPSISCVALVVASYSSIGLQVPFLKLHSSVPKVDVFAFHANDSHRSLGWIFEEPTRKLLMRFPLAATCGSIVMRARLRSFSSSIPIEFIE